MSTAEKWCWIDGYEGLYMVSDQGQIMGTPKKTTCGHVLNLTKKKAGYVHVCLCKDNEKRTYSVHRLVAKAFVANPNGKPEVNHINGNRSDNRAENLEWVTRGENEVHAFRVLGKKPNAPWRGKPRECARRFTHDQVRAIREDARPSKAVAAEYGVSSTTVKNIRNKTIYREVV